MSNLLGANLQEVVFLFCFSPKEEQPGAGKGKAYKIRAKQAKLARPPTRWIPLQQNQYQQQNTNLHMFFSIMLIQDCKSSVLLQRNVVSIISYENNNFIACDRQF